MTSHQHHHQHNIGLGLLNGGVTAAAVFFVVIMGFAGLVFLVAYPLLAAGILLAVVALGLTVLIQREQHSHR